jgi:hypothetical protein
VLNHLDEEAQAAWLAEFRRVLRPDGLLMVSVFSELAARCLSPGLRTRLDSDGIVFFDNGGTPGLPDWYQCCFHTRGYIERQWGSEWIVAGYLPRSLIMSSQDLVILVNRQPGQEVAR